MQPVRRMPNIAEVIDPLLGRSYAEYDCWGLLRHVLHVGFDIDIVGNPTQAAEQVCEVWVRGDPRAPLSLVQPWDWLIFITRPRLLVTNHVGLVIDPTQMVHTGEKTGVCLQRLTPRWGERLFQIARLRMLL